MNRARGAAWPGTLARGAVGVRKAGRTCAAFAVAATAAGGFLLWQPAAGAEAFAGTAVSAGAAPRARTTAITVNGRLPGATFDGVGAISGGGGNSRYLIDYPEPERSQILDYLFRPGYGASLQMLKLEIGGDSNSSSGSEPSIEHTQGAINCNAGYEWWIAEQAVKRNPGIKLYGLQWGAPGWTGDGAGGFWTPQDVNYVIDWLNCARSHGLTISYLGGRDEAGSNRAWYEQLRAALDAHGYGRVRIVAGDQTNARHWAVARTMAKHPAFARAVSIIGEHDSCLPREYHCATTTFARASHKPLWLAEQGGVNPDTQAANLVRAVNRMYIQGGMTGLLEWPLLASMPAGLPYEGRGLVIADQPWSGAYHVTKLIWATAQTTQFVRPGWRYVRHAGKLLGDSGSADTYMAPNGSDWSMVAENTGSYPGQKIRPQRIDVTVAGGLKDNAIHVWATNLQTMKSSQWFVQAPTIQPAGGRFRYTIPPGYVVTFTTTTGQSKAGGSPPAVPRGSTLPLPYPGPRSANPFTTNDGSDEPPLLAPVDGAFGLVPCLGRIRGTCVQQLVPDTPVLWHSKNLDYPYAILGDPNWADYTVSVKVLMQSPTDTAGVIGRFTERASRTGSGSNAVGLFDGYTLDVTENGAWQILRTAVTSRIPVVLASGSVPDLGTDRWHTMSLSLRGGTITGFIDGVKMGSATDASYRRGLAGIEAGAFTDTWPQDQYRDLSVTPLP